MQRPKEFSCHEEFWVEGCTIVQGLRAILTWNKVICHCRIGRITLKGD